MRKVDARNLACPKPVLLTKEAISDEAVDAIEVLVDNLAALENVKRFATNFGFEIVKVETVGKDFHIFAKRAESTVDDSSFDVNEYPCPVPQPKQGKTIFFNSEFLGVGADELGALLMKAFIFTLNEVNNLPARLIFMNSGVKLCVEGAITLENLQQLEAKGVDFLVCGTCLDFYKLTDKLRVGKISNMYDIAEYLTGNDSLLTV